MNVKTDDPAEYLIESARRTGVACATTSDGTIFIFTAEKLAELLQKVEASGRDVGVVFVARQDASMSS